MTELNLYKLVNSDIVTEKGWINDSEFCVWVNYIALDEFVEELKKLFGNGIFDDGGFNANMQEYGVCIDLCSVVTDDIDMKEVFPVVEYQH